jgi:hypothetical protein
VAESNVNMTIIRQPRYPVLNIPQSAEQPARMAATSVISGQFTFRQPTRLNGDELDRRWFEPYPSQD